MLTTRPTFWQRHFSNPVRRWMGREVYALPIDIFRILVGALALFYFGRLIAEFPHFTHPDGLIDHAMLQEVYWFTRISLFQAGTPAFVLFAAQIIGLVGAVAIILGYRTKLAAGILLAIAASTYRWNFLVMYLDDGIMHLMLFWLLLLPVGKTLRLDELLRDRRQALRRWSDTVVPGAAVWCMLANICLIYFLAGVWKLDSLLWRDGLGLYAALQLPISATAGRWGVEHLPMLRVANHATMLLESLFPLAMLLTHRPLIKRVTAVMFVGFHLSIFFTIGIPVASFGLMATLPLFFHSEVGGWFARRRGPRAVRAPAATTHVPRTGWAALAFLLTLLTATTRNVPYFGVLNEPAYAALWMVGVAQDYRLFNWIDKVNYRIDTQVALTQPNGSTTDLDAGDVYPASMRSGLIQAYAHNVRWMVFPREHRQRIRSRIAQRVADRYCEGHDVDGIITISSRFARIVPDNLDGHRAARLLLAEFRCTEIGPFMLRSLVWNPRHLLPVEPQT